MLRRACKKLPGCACVSAVTSDPLHAGALDTGWLHCSRASMVGPFWLIHQP